MLQHTVTHVTTNGDTCYNKIPKSEIEHQEGEKSIEEWQQQWDNTAKGLVTKDFFSKH
jgi:hypothetical protein